MPVLANTSANEVDTGGHIKLASRVRYLGIEVDDALELSEAIDI